jgi:hypothetical protein
VRHETLFAGEFTLELVENHGRLNLVVTDCVNEVPPFVASCTPANLLAVLRGIKYHIVGGDNITTFRLDGEDVMFKIRREGEHSMSCRIPCGHFYAIVHALSDRRIRGRAYMA